MRKLYSENAFIYDTKILFTLLFAACTALMVYASFADLAIDKALFSPHSNLGYYFEFYGFLPLYLPAVLLGPILFHMLKGAAQMAAGAYTICAACALSYVTASRVFEEAGAPAPTVYVLSAGFLAAALFMTAFSRANRKTLQSWLFACGFGTAYMVIGNIIINAIKFVFGRARFFDMAATGTFASFTPWYLPQWFTGETSFPSGHVFGASGILFLAVLMHVSGFGKAARNIGLVFMYGYIFLMAYARVLIGKHFLSDVIASVIITAAIFLTMTNHSIYKDYAKRI